MKVVSADQRHGHCIKSDRRCVGLDLAKQATTVRIEGENFTAVDDLDSIQAGVTNVNRRPT